jgi:twitching motility protein PilT
MTTVTTPDSRILQPKPFQSSGDTEAFIKELIGYARENDASDLHIGSKISMEIYGTLYDVEGAAGIDEVTLQNLIKNFIKDNLSEHEVERVTGHVGVADGASRKVQGVTVRVHAYKSREKLHLSLRLLKPGVPSFEDLNLPNAIRSFTEFESGIVLFTGKTGAGKTSSLAALIDIINRTKRHHIYTLEDPIEYEHQQYPNNLITQTEIGPDVISYEEGLRAVLRAAPKVMVFAELRDAVSVQAALHASASGHLVFSTLHTSEAAETVQRIINYFPPEQHNNVRYQFAQALRASVSQRLVPRMDGKGRVPACEILVSTSAIKTMLEDPERIKQLRNTIKSGKADGMQTLEADLSRLVSENIVDLTDAKRATNYPEEVKAGGPGRI